MARANQASKARTEVVAGLRIGRTLTTFRGTAKTADAAVTTLASYTPAAGKLVVIEAVVAARQSDGSAGGGYKVVSTFRRAGAVTTQIGTPTVVATHEDTAGWNATLDASGADVRVRVTGAASTA